MSLDAGFWNKYLTAKYVAGEAGSFCINCSIASLLEPIILVYRCVVFVRISSVTEVASIVATSALKAAISFSKPVYRLYNLSIDLLYSPPTRVMSYAAPTLVTPNFICAPCSKITGIPGGFVFPNVRKYNVLVSDPEPINSNMPPLATYALS